MRITDVRVFTDGWCFFEEGEHRGSEWCPTVHVFHNGEAVISFTDYMDAWRYIEAQGAKLETNPNVDPQPPVGSRFAQWLAV